MPLAARLDPGLHRRLVDSLYIEAMVMADEARAYFDGPEAQDAAAMNALQRVAFTCEALKVTTRLMHVIAWLLTQRAWQRGEIGAAEIIGAKYQLGPAHVTDPGVIASFPFAARALVEGSEELYDRVARLEERMLSVARGGLSPEPGPARALMDRLHTAF